MNAERNERDHYYGPVAALIPEPKSRPKLEHMPQGGDPVEHLIEHVRASDMQVYTELNGMRSAIIYLDRHMADRDNGIQETLGNILEQIQKERDSIPNLISDAVSEATGPHNVPHDAITPGKLEAALNARALLEQARNADKRSAELEKGAAERKAEDDKRAAEKRAWWRGLALALAVFVAERGIEWLAKGHP